MIRAISPISPLLVNAITPIKTWKTPFLRLLFFLPGHVPGLGSGLVNRSFIHFARPRLAESQPEERPHYDYLLFFSNFNLLGKTAQNRAVFTARSGRTCRFFLSNRPGTQSRKSTCGWGRERKKKTGRLTPFRPQGCLRFGFVPRKCSRRPVMFFLACVEAARALTGVFVSQ